jgi:hypothetical protein
MLARNDERLRIVLLTCRDPATDFRLPLAEELQSLGNDVYYVYLKRRPVVVDMGNREVRREFSLIEFLSYMSRKFRGARPLLVFNSTNLVFPVLSNVLRALCGGFWFLDMHDDLLYGKKGLARLKARIAQRILVAGSDQIVHAAPTLKELFPSSVHLGNASTMTALERPNPDLRKILVLASIDERMDFEFLTAAAQLNPDRSFYVYGQIAGNNAEIKSRVDQMVRSAPNIHYKGPYVNSDLPGILSEYAVTLAPYVVDSPLTYYVDPLRYYHCLNSGMEIISTAIPKARDFEDALHIVSDAAQIGPVIKGLENGSTAARNAGSTAPVHNWRNRAVKLTQIFEMRNRHDSTDDTKH